MTTTAELKGNLEKAKLKLYQKFLDDYNESEANIINNYNMGIIHLEEKIEQLRLIGASFVRDVKANNIQEFKFNN